VPDMLAVPTAASAHVPFIQLTRSKHGSATSKQQTSSV
jgi:hypothetical protein